MKSSNPIRILSLGCGVQSSCLALMMREGEIEPVDNAVFADTGCEPQVVYDYLDYLRPLLPFPVHVVSAGNIADDFIESLADADRRCGQPPFYVYDQAKEKHGVLWRQCTSDYKIQPIRRKSQELREGRPVEQLIGISLDESHRMKDSGVRYITNAYPLIDLRMSRHDCLQWIKRHGYSVPPKSACWLCPYMSNARLRQMKDKTPEEWGKLVEFDSKMRQMQQEVINGAKITGTLYVHRSCIPIDQVDLSTDADRGQLDMFGEECEGMCGL